VGPTDAYNEKIHSRLEKSVWAQWMSWHRVGGNGKINTFPAYVNSFGSSVITYPWFIIRAASVFWLWLRKPNWSHYKVSPDGRWLERQLELLRRKRRAQIWCTLTLGVVVMALHSQWRELVLGWCNS